MCVIVEFALVLQAADEVRCAVIYLYNGVAQLVPPSLSCYCYLSVAFAYMCFLGLVLVSFLGLISIIRQSVQFLFPWPA